MREHASTVIKVDWGSTSWATRSGARNVASKNPLRHHRLDLLDYIYDDEAGNKHCKLPERVSLDFDAGDLMIRSMMSMWVVHAANRCKRSQCCEFMVQYSITHAQQVMLMVMLEMHLIRLATCTCVSAYIRFTST